MNNKFIIAARSMGYRMGKSSAERYMRNHKKDYEPNFHELFKEAYALEAKNGYREGYQFILNKFNDVSS